MEEILDGKGLVEVAADKVHVTGLKGPLEDGWQKKVEAFAARLSGTLSAGDDARGGATASPTREASAA
jgi:hypothetical protein